MKPAATAATALCWSGDSAANPVAGVPIRRPPKISCSIGLAISRTPMPAETFRQSTAQSSQNCGVLCASLTCTDDTAPAVTRAPASGVTR